MNNIFLQGLSAQRAQGQTRIAPLASTGRPSEINHTLEQPAGGRSFGFSLGYAQVSVLLCRNWTWLK